LFIILIFTLVKILIMKAIWRNKYPIVLLGFVLIVAPNFTTAQNPSNPVRVRSGSIQVDFSESRSIQGQQMEMVDPATVQAELRVNKQPVYHALIIGVSEYQYAGPQLTNLDNPLKDAQRLKEILISKYLFTEETTYVLTNPTREQLINSMDELTQKVGERDNLLIFYAGHGFYDKNTDFGYWLPSDAKMTSRSNWIANSTIKDYVSAIPSKHTLLISDACFAGSIFKTRAATALDTRKVYEMYREKSRKAITSGNLTQVPDESYFLKFLLKILTDNEQDFLPASALFSRMYEPIMNNSETIPQFAVIYGAGDEGGDFIFIRK